MDILGEYQRDTFVSLPVRVRSDDEEQEVNQTATTPAQNPHNRESAQAVVEVFPFPTWHNSNSANNSGAEVTLVNC